MGNATNKKMKDKILHSSKIFGPIGGIAGFIADVITPLGNYLLWISISLLIITALLTIIFFIKRNSFGKSIGEKYLPQSIVLSIVFGFFGLIGINSDKGFFSDNFEPISNLQSSLFNIEQGVKRVENKVDKIAGDISDIKNIVTSDLADIDKRINEIENKISTGSKIKNPLNLEDYLINSIVSYNNGDLKETELMLEKVFKEGYIKYDLAYKYYEALFNNYNGDNDRIKNKLKQNNLQDNIIFNSVQIDFNLKGTEYYSALNKLNITDPILKAYLENKKAKSFYIDNQYQKDYKKNHSYWTKKMVANEKVLGKKMMKAKSLFFDYNNSYKDYLTNTSYSNDENSVWQFYNR